MTLAQQIEARWQAWWPELAPREQRLIGGAAAVVVLALLWWLALAPALRTLASAPAEHARLDAQLQQMQALQAQARALQSQPRANRDDAVRALESSVRQSFGADAQLQPAGGGDAVGLSVRGAPAAALGDWLAQARNNARAIPREVHITRSQAAAAPAPATPRGSGTPSDGGAAAPTVRWDGTLVMGLPAAR
ncbi:MAG: general secretion pathway protein GspM [Variovorax paradoxus]|uniref:General secretion pathway protein GspM n=1 Tax=Variovorax paradoxus TaxID=34073 RepID=A0A2W5QIZ5_VARPD|nr:MAG: general secretion pathway protein GspM [Variovorax paradoxus]